MSVSRDIAASADTLWAMVSDVTRMGEWSPENEGGEWLDAPLVERAGVAPGAKFRSRNRLGRRAWSTVATVLEADPGRVFSFRVTAGPVQVADWSYTFEAVDDGCRVTETWTDRRAGWFKPIGHLATGVGDREAHNRAGMEQTLAGLAAVAEGAASA